MNQISNMMNRFNRHWFVCPSATWSSQRQWKITKWLKIIPIAMLCWDAVLKDPNTSSVLWQSSHQPTGCSSRLSCRLLVSDGAGVIAMFCDFRRDCLWLVDDTRQCLKRFHCSVDSQCHAWTRQVQIVWDSSQVGHKTFLKQYLDHVVHDTLLTFKHLQINISC